MIAVNLKRIAAAVAVASDIFSLSSLLGYDVIPKLAFLIPNQMFEILKSL